MSSDDGKGLPAKIADKKENPKNDDIEEIYTSGAEALRDAECHSDSDDDINYVDIDLDAEVSEVLSHLEGMSYDDVIDKNIDKFVDEIEKQLTENVFAEFDRKAEQIYEETQRKRLELEEEYRREQEQFEQDLAKLKQQIIDSLKLLDDAEEQDRLDEFDLQQKEKEKQQTHQSQQPQPGFSGNVAKSS